MEQGVWKGCDTTGGKKNFLMIVPSYMCSRWAGREFGQTAQVRTN